MTNDALREKVARIIAAEIGWPEPTPEDDSVIWQDFLPEADAAIAAIREHDAGAGWMPIATFRSNGKPVDLWCEGHRWTDMYWIDSSPAYPSGSWGKDPLDWPNAIALSPTHWCSAPAAPDAETEREGGR
ncbi:hypothetical protein [Amaricoccus solimangrovi]|uniref:Uncharacterized protein n=1 Tax=Amaricoccus solimangrovi TaxID=2589815 RepID=A0A501WUU2_9RHOB|nr:hypothetical protein [Amaricoccus solimangrovi]TPE53049.1 hypothetical protein FJM51_03215 [Amaricoccus solimangrovi]